jgi:hypothetical protein
LFLTHRGARPSTSTLGRGHRSSRHDIVGSDVSHTPCQRQRTRPWALMPRGGAVFCVRRRERHAQSLSLPCVAFVVRLSQRPAASVPARAASLVEPILVRLSGQFASEVWLAAGTSVGVFALTRRSRGTRRHRALNRLANACIIASARAILGAPLSLLR